MEYSIFFSWQSDAPYDCNRSFIREELDKAVARIAENPKIEDSPRVDSDIQGISGTPEVASSIFEKIKQCAIFVGDMTLVGHCGEVEPRKRTPNPNVLLEMGFAAATIGWHRIICVMNEHFGSRNELPFDIRNRRYPINYNLAPSNKTNAVTNLPNLVDSLQFEIETVKKNDYLAVDGVICSLDIDCLDLLSEYGQRDFFVLPDYPSQNKDTIIHIKNNTAIIRLLTLRLLKTDIKSSMYAYHWTYLGKQVLIRLSIRTPNEISP